MEVKKKLFPACILDNITNDIWYVRVFVFTIKAIEVILFSTTFTNKNISFEG